MIRFLIQFSTKLHLFFLCNLHSTVFFHMRWMSRTCSFLIWVGCSFVWDPGKADSTKIVLLNLFEDEHIAWSEDMQGTIR